MIGIAYNNLNEVEMKNELSSLIYQGIKDIHLMKFSFEDVDTIICDTTFDYMAYKNKSIILIIEDVKDWIVKSETIILIQYESLFIKKEMEEKFSWLKDIDNVIINRIPMQKKEIKPLSSQDSTIFFHGEDKEENMVDEMFELDRETHYTIRFYDNNTKEIPSKKHRLSWNVTSKNNGYINYKIMKEIEDGCLPILLKENMPRYFFAYPFSISLEELKDKEKLINKVKEISHYISKMTRDEFKELANSMYNSIYINTNWKYNFYYIANKIKDI